MEDEPIGIEEEQTEEEMRRTRMRDNQSAIRLLRSWDDATDQDQARTLDELKAAIDANRIDQRKHFS